MKSLFAKWMIATALAGCAALSFVTVPGVTVTAQAQGVVVQFAPSAPPPLREERIPPPPRGMRHPVWARGHWNWDGRNWIWVSGGYVVAPRRHVRWHEGGWVARDGHWVWVEGGWR